MKNEANHVFDQIFASICVFTLTLCVFAPSRRCWCERSEAKGEETSVLTGDGSVWVLQDSIQMNLKAVKGPISVVVSEMRLLPGTYTTTGESFVTVERSRIRTVPLNTGSCMVSHSHL